jgi:hypothetical protein
MRQYLSNERGNTVMKSQLINQLFSYKDTEESSVANILHFKKIKLKTKIGQFGEGEKFEEGTIFLEDGVLSLSRKEKKEFAHYECTLKIKASHLKRIK